jgi:pimeloyl-ACP methyl ester carboxylesterase
MMNRMPTPLVRILFFVAIATAAVLVWSLLLHGMKNSTLFFPERYPAGFWDMSGLAVQPAEHWIETPDRVRLHALLFAAADGPEAPLLLHYHGNGGNLSYRAPIAAGLAARGVSTLLFDYRGYGRSEGRPTEKDLEIDALAVWDYATSILGFAPDNVALFGESLGGAYAARVASEHPVRCLVIESSFPSARAVAGTIYPLGPLLFPLSGSLPTSKWLSKSDAPVLVFHGTRDEVIDFRLGRALYESISSEKEFLAIERAGHNDIIDVGGDALFDRIAEFVRRERG